VLGKELYQMFRWLNQEGFRADIKELRRCYPEVHFQTLEEWLRNEGWHKTSSPSSASQTRKRSELATGVN
jgi:hypothetical protein